jgi:hypothetical protein
MCRSTGKRGSGIIILSFVLIVFARGWIPASVEGSITVGPSPKTIASIPPPAGFHRLPTAPQSFANWLRQLPLKPTPSPVLDYRGRIHKKSTDTTLATVIDLDVKGKRMQQCMDILVRLRAEYLWKQQAYHLISFPLPGGYVLHWTDWASGLRPRFRGIEMQLQQVSQPDSSRRNFENYLKIIFAESHSQQFYHAYPQIEPAMVAIGDFIVKKGVKGHAVLIVDMAENTNGNKVALIGHGDTPACEFHLLNFRKNNPWFPLDFSQTSLPLPIRREMTWDGLRRFP